MNNKIFKLAILQILIAIAGAVLYSFIADAANTDWIIIGFVIAVGVPLTYLSAWLVKKMNIRDYKWVYITGMVAVLFGFFARTATQSYILYDHQFVPQEKAAEQDEGSYVSDQDVRSRTDEVLRQKTGYPSYIGAFIWYLHHTNVKEDQYGDTTSHDASFTEATLLWLGDLVAGLFVVASGLWKELGKIPMKCSLCGKVKKKKFYIMGPSDLTSQVIAAAKNKDIQTLKSLYAPKSSTPQDFVSLRAWVCETCQNEDIEVDFVITKRGRPLVKNTKIPFTPQEFAELVKIFQKP